MLELLLHSAVGLELFNEGHRLQAMLDFEGGLARAQAKLGVIPEGAAEPICSCCRAYLFDREALAEGAARAGNLAIPMVKQLTALVRERSQEAGAYVHWGATSQDAIDTGMVLQLRSELKILEAQLKDLCGVISDLTVRHRYTLTAGRTWLQHAVPVTFGLKTAGWLDAVLRHRERLGELKGRVLTLQFGGAAGTLASLGSRGLEIGAVLADELNLRLPPLPWHSHRDRMAEVACFHGLLMGTLGKIARDLSLMMQTEVGEAAEAAGVGAGGSSTMPHKRNPVAAATVLSAAVRVPGLVGTMLSAMVQEHERGLGGWHAEWETLPEICTLTLGSAEKLTAMLKDIEIYPGAMQLNLSRTRGLLLAEAVSMELAQSLGKERAHRMIEAASRSAIAREIGLREVVEGDLEIMKYLTSEQLDKLFDPACYTGDAQQMIDRVLTGYAAQETAMRGET